MNRQHRNPIAFVLLCVPKLFVRVRLSGGPTGNRTLTLCVQSRSSTVRLSAQKQGASIMSKGKLSKQAQRERERELGTKFFNIFVMLYAPLLVPRIGFEPMTHALRVRCSARLS